MKKKSIVWFRQDLRLHDNEALTEAILSTDEILPVFIFDERVFLNKTAFGFHKTDKFRAQFIIESVQNLRENLRKKGADLIIKIGKPEQVITDIALKLKTSYVFCNRERTHEELKVQDALEQNLWSIGQEIRYCRGKMLYYTADLPFPIMQTPESFTQYRKEVEKITPIRKPLEAPAAIKMILCDIKSDKIPTLEDFGLSNFELDQRSVLDFKGGETAGLERLEYYIWDKELLKTYEETRNGMLGSDYSTKFSVWLAQGCLSPKLIYDEIKKYEAAHGANKSTYWLYFELLWRDYFRLIGKKHGNKIFQQNGIIGKNKKKNANDLSKFQDWMQGKTPNEFINANMLELKNTGFMSNRGRQNVASYLINDMGINWLMGAEYFESVLIDYDPCSNYCNWCYLAGVGNDPREDRYFNTNSQVQKYDPQGLYINTWTQSEKVI